MPSPFEAAWAARRNDLLSRFREIEGFLWEPQAAPYVLIAGASVPDGNADTVPDPERPISAVSGVFVEKGAVLHAHGRSMADSTTRPAVAEVPTLIVGFEEIASRVAVRDQVTRLRTGEAFVVTKIVRQPFDRGYVHLARFR